MFQYQSPRCRNSLLRLRAQLLAEVVAAMLAEEGGMRVVLLYIVFSRKTARRSGYGVESLSLPLLQLDLAWRKPSFSY